MHSDQSQLQKGIATHGKAACHGSSRQSRSLSVARQMPARASTAVACRAYRTKKRPPTDYSVRRRNSFSPRYHFCYRITPVSLPCLPHMHPYHPVLHRGLTDFPITGEFRSGLIRSAIRISHQIPFALTARR